MMLKQKYLEAKTYAEFVESAAEHRELWRAMYDRARLPEVILERAREIPGEWRLLVLAEDWCSDAYSSIPYLARLADLVPALELRLLERDRHPELMDAHLTNGARSIPVVVVVDADGEELGWWGPRPAELQEWFVREGKRLPSEERNREKRRWYARDRGESTLNEVVSLLEAAARARISA